MVIMSVSEKDAEEDFNEGFILPPLIVQLRKILDQYPDDSQIFKELLQNAEDAGAKEVKFLYDKRSYGTNPKYLQNPKLASYQGPALYAYNDGLFDDNDWKGIRMLSQSVKQKDPLKVGYFGMGFKSVFHITDMPFILSGDKAGVIDPHTDVFESTSHGWNLSKGVNLYDTMPHQFEPFVNIFGCSKNTFKDGYYNGTLFRFPLRTKASPLSDIVYTEDKMQGLLETLSEDAHLLLLFLRHVEVIEVYERDKFAQTPKLVFKVSLSENCREKVRSHRKDFLQQTRSAHLLTSPLVSTFPVTVETHSYFKKEPCTETWSWLVTNYFVGGSVSAIFKKLQKDSDLSYTPWVGTAMPLVTPSNATHDGRVFCFLPLPADQGSLTGLPVHVNGSFAVEQNRKYLKWSSSRSYRSREELMDKKLMWNHCMLKEAMPKAYVELLLTGIKSMKNSTIEGLNLETLYQAIPDLRKVERKWSEVLPGLFSELLKFPVVYSATGGGNWLPVSDIVFNTLDVSESTFHVILKVLEAGNVHVATVPQHVQHAVESFSQQVVSKVSPDIIASTFQTIQKTVEFSWEEKIELLKHFLTNKNYSLLNGLQLLPLASGKFQMFESYTNNPRNIVYISDEEEILDIFLPRLPDSFIARNLDKSIIDSLVQASNRGYRQLKKVDKSTFSTLLSHCLPQDWFCGTIVSWTPEMNHHPPVSWLESLWGYLVKNFPLSLESIEQIPLVPLSQVTSSSSEVQLVPLASKQVLVLREMDGISLGDGLEDVLKNLGLVVIEELPDFIKAHPIVSHHYLFSPSYIGVIKALQKLEQVNGNGYAIGNVRELAPEDKSTFVKLLSKISKYELTEEHQELLSALPIFETIKASEENMPEFVSFSDVSITGPAAKLPVRLTQKLLDLSNPYSLNLARVLGVQEMTEEDILINIVFRDIEDAMYELEEIEKVMLHVLKHYQMYVDQCASFQDVLRTLTFMPRKDVLLTPDRFYDPDNELLQQMFLGEAMFPAGAYAEPSIAAVLGQIGLRGLQDVEPEDLMESAYCVEDITSRSDTDFQTALTKSDALMKYLQRYPMILQDDCEGEPLSEKLKDIRWVRRLQEKPNFYPKCLSWFDGDYFYKPSAMVSRRNAHLVGSVMPSVAIEMADSVDERLGWNESPDMTFIIQHLANAVAAYNHTEKAAFVETVSSIYFKLDQHNVDDVMKCLADSNITEWIWHGDGFGSPDNVFFSEAFMDLTPYVHSISGELHSFRDLFQSCGVKENCDLTDVLMKIKQRNQECEENPEGLVKKDLNLAVSILNELKSHVVDEAPSDYQENLFLPVHESTTTFLKMAPVKDCTYCDVEWIRQGFDLKDLEEGSGRRILLVHPNVPVGTSEILGVPTLMSRVLDAEELDYSFGQTDSLTHRLNALLQEYTDGFAVPKEIVQNADDAGATEVKFLYDERQNADSLTCLIDEGMKECQGPALWAYNNAVFTDEDFENITKLSGATKEKKTDKIGRFGLGFNAVYNLTDVPSFVSRHNIVIFDPHTTHLGKSIKNKAKPGIKIDMRKHRKKLRRLDNQFKPYHDVFGCDLRSGSRQDSYPGTLFRFPLRTKHQALRSEICQKHYDDNEVRLLLQMVVKKAENLMLYTQNILKISLYHLSGKATSPLEASELFTIEKVPIKIIRQPKGDYQLPESSKELSLAEQQMIEASSMLRVSSHCMQKIRSGETMNGKDMPRSSFVCELQMDISTQCEIMLEVKRTHLTQTWLLSNYMGNGEAMNVAVQDDSLIPIAGVAIQVSHCQDGIYQPIPITKKRTKVHNGTVFSFLPLPVRSGLPVHINAAFAVTPSRRHLCQKSEDDKYDVRTQWNNALLSGPVCKAYIQALEDVRALANDSGYVYWELWPRPEYFDSSFTPLVHAFYQLLGDSNEDESTGLFSDGLNWQTLAGTNFLEPDYVVKAIGPTALDTFRSCTAGNKPVVAELPSWVQHSFDMASVGHLIKNQTYDVDVFFRDIVMPNIGHIESCKRELLVLDALLSEEENLLQIIKDNACIPTSPSGKNLLKPKELINPHAAMAKLFSVSDGRFPHSSYASSKCLRILENLGMSRDTLAWADISERAMYFESEWEVGSNANRSQLLLEHLNAKLVSVEGEEETEEQLTCQEKLATSKMLPVLQRPTWFPVQWASDLRATNDLASVCEVFAPEHCDLVCCMSLVADPDVFPSDSERLKDFLGMKEKQPDLDIVIKQLDIISSTEVEEGLADGVVFQAISRMCIKIYEYLQERCLEKVSKKKIQRILKKKKFILSKKTFLYPDQITFDFPHSCEPYLYGLSDSHRNNFSLLMQTVGVRESFSTKDFVQALQKLHLDFKNLELDREQLKLALQLVNLLNDSMEDLDQSLSEVVEDHGTIYIPDAGNVLRSASGLCFNEPDCHWLPSTEHSNYSHPLIPFSISKQLGVNTKRQEVLKKHSRGIPFGQREKLTNRLKRILGSYPCDKEILKEILQNADDATATEIHFIKDMRQHGTDRVFDESWKPLQGPALCVYNNRPFSEADIEGIQRLGEGTKGTDPNKTGQYGIGFNCVYHLTDVPSFLTQSDNSGETLCVFDPHGKFVPGASVEEPGRRYDDVDELRHIFTDVFPCYLEDKFPLKNSTMFRFPLRTEEMAMKSELSEMAVSVEMIDELFTKFRDELFDSLLFLNNISTISLTEIGHASKRLTNTFKVTVEVAHGANEKAKFAKSVKMLTSRLSSGKMKVWDIPMSDVTYVLKLSDNKGHWETWLVTQQIGFSREIRASQALKDAFARKDLVLIPRGGVASMIDASSATPYQRSKKAFCFLPLPLKTDLMVHVNGHFALESEARRNIWADDEGSPKDEWNKLILSKVIAPAYVTMLKHSQSLLADCSLNYSSDASLDIDGSVNTDLELYGELFPKLGKVSGIWKSLVLSVYKHIHNAKVPILPVIKTSSQSQSSSVSEVLNNSRAADTEWLPTCSKQGNIPYFDNLSSYFADDQDLTFSGVTSRRKIVTSTPKKRASCDVLRQVFLSAGIKLVKLPLFVFEAFVEAGVDVECISPRAVVDFFLSYDTPGSECVIGSLPCDIHDTTLQSESTLLVVVGYCISVESYYFFSNLEQLPLLLSEDGQLRQFSSSDRVFLTNFHDLLPSLEHRFIHHSLAKSIFKDLDINDYTVFNKFDIPTFAQLLPRVLSSSRYRGDKGHIEWPDDGNSLVDAKWLWQLWSFLKQEYTRRFNELSVIEGNPVEEMLQPLCDWCLLPAVVPSPSRKSVSFSDYESDDNKHYLVPIGLASTVMSYSEASIMSYPLKDCLKGLQIPELNSKILDGGQMSPVGKNISPISSNSNFAKQLAGSLEKPKSVLKCLHFAFSRPSQRDITVEECAVICKYLNDTVESWSDDFEAQLLLKRLPVFQTLQGEIAKLGKNEVYVFPNDFPQTSTGGWETETGFSFLREQSNMKDLYQALHFSILSFTEAYKRFLLPGFKCLSKQMQIQHLLYLRDSKLAQLGESEQSDILDGLRNIEFLEDRDGFLRKPCEFYDPNHPVFKVMLEPNASQFPPHPFCDHRWLVFLRKIGIQSEVSSEMFVHFANEIAYEGQNAPCDETFHKSRKLVNCLFKMRNLPSQGLLEKLADIPFIPAAKVNNTLKKICPPFCDSDVDSYTYISYKEGVPEKHENLVWSSSCLIPDWANPFKLSESSVSYSFPEDADYDFDKYRNSIAASLGVTQNPSIPTVIKHIQNVCKSDMSADQNMNDLQAFLKMDIMKKVYRFLQSELEGKSDHLDLKELQEIPCIVIDFGKTLVRPRQVVINLYEDDQICPYLFKAPTELGEFQSLFVSIGAALNATCDQYAMVLEQIFIESDGDKLHPNEMRLAFRAVYGLFKSLQKNRSQNFSVSKLYLPSSTGKLVLSTSLVFIDDYSYSERIQFFDRPYLVDLSECNLKADNFTHLLQLLPRDLRPTELTSLVDEMLEHQSRNGLHIHGISEKLRHQLSSKAFAQAIRRLLKHEHKKSGHKIKADVLAQIENKLKRVMVYGAEKLSTYLMYNNERLHESESESQCFAEKKVDESGTELWTICINSSVGFSEELLVSIAEVVNEMIGGLLSHSVHYIQPILTCTPYSIPMVLDKLHVRPDHSAETHQTTLPAPGSFIPVDDHHLLEESFPEFETGEYVGYEVLDDETGGRIIVYAIIAGKVAKETEIPDGNSEATVFTQLYNINIGEEREPIPASATDLYKFVRVEGFVARQSTAYDSQRLFSGRTSSSATAPNTPHPKYRESFYESSVFEPQSPMPDNAPQESENGSVGEGHSQFPPQEREDIRHRRHMLSKRQHAKRDDKLDGFSDDSQAAGSALTKSTNVRPFIHRKAQTDTTSVAEDAQKINEELSEEASEIQRAMNEVSDAMEEAWKLPEKEKKKVMKRLLLKWHPDKNVGNEEFATIITQHIHSELERLELGLPRPSKMKEFTFDPRNPFAHSASFQKNFYNAYQFFFEQMNRRAKEHKEQRKRYRENFSREYNAQGDYNFDVPPTFASSNPQPAQAKRFLKQAQEDLRAADNDYETKEPAYEWVCFKGHQAAEKALKAAQFSVDAATSFSHDLISLAAAVEDLELRRLAQRLQRIVGNSNKLYNPDPIDFVVIPHEEYTRDMACDVVMCAADILERVKEFVDTKE